MLPRVKITYSNGALGQVAEMDDGCLGFIAIGAAEVAGEENFKLGKAYSLKKLADLESLGVTSENNPNLYRNVKDFYAEGGDGLELWLMGFAETAAFATVLDKDNAGGAKSLLLSAKGNIRGLIAFKTPGESYELDDSEGMDSDVIAALPKAQALGEWATDDRYAPIFTLIEGYAYSGNDTGLPDLKTMNHDRCGIVIGDTSQESPNAAMGIVAGRIAATDVQRKISRVKSGALTPVEMFVGGKTVEEADVESINDKGYITFRTFVGKSGYFIADDPLATAATDDYNSLSNRRVIDKAYRIAYNTLVESLNDEVPIATDGTLSPAWCVSVQGDVEQAIISSMTANGNLGNDPADPDDTGVECSIDYKQDILATSRIAAGLRVKPNGYAKYIDVDLGFKTT